MSGPAGVAAAQPPRPSTVLQMRRLGLLSRYSLPERIELEHRARSRWLRTGVPALPMPIAPVPAGNGSAGDDGAAA